MHLRVVQSTLFLRKNCFKFNSAYFLFIYVRHKKNKDFFLPPLMSRNVYIQCVHFYTVLLATISQNKKGWNLKLVLKATEICFSFDFSWDKKSYSTFIACYIALYFVLACRMYAYDEGITILLEKIMFLFSNFKREIRRRQETIGEEEGNSKKRKRGMLHKAYVYTNYTIYRYEYFCFYFHFALFCNNGM